MTESQPVKWNEDRILAHLKLLAREQLNMTPDQVAAITPETRLLDGLQLDSLAQVVLVSSIEKDFGCSFDAEQWQDLETVEDLLKMIAARACAPEASPA